MTFNLEDFNLATDKDYQCHALKNGVLAIFSKRVANNLFKIAPWYGGITKEECMKAVSEAVQEAFDKE